MSRQSPTVLSSLFVAKPGENQSQKCVYLNCKATVRSVEKFSHELFISRAEDEDLSDSLFPADIAFSVDPGMKLEIVEPSKDDPGRLSWCDRAGKRYNLDFESSTDVHEFFVAIGRALYELHHSTPADNVTDSELMNLLLESNRPSGMSDLLSTAGELCRKDVRLFNYDVEREQFTPMFNYPVLATINSAVVNEDNSRSYLVMLFNASTGQHLLEQMISNDMAPQFFAATRSFVWIMKLDPEDEEPTDTNQELDPLKQLCLSMKFESVDDMNAFREQFTVCLYEVNHNVSIAHMKLKPEDRTFVEDSLRDDVEPMDIDDDIDPSDVEDERRIKDDVSQQRTSVNDWNDNELNSQLAVGASSDRTFVVRGGQMGVFKTDAEAADLQATVMFWDPKQKGARFTPSKVMLHERDSTMLLLDKKDPTRVMRMDLERGEIVDTWKGDAIASAQIDSIQRSAKYAHLTAAQDFVAVNKSQLMRMDPRSKEFIVQSKKYAASTRAKLECVATTGAGYLAVASETGDIRLYDQIGKNAKTHLPGLGDKIIGIDVTEDGHTVLATTAKYLLIVDTRVKGQEKGGFLKSMGKNKPPPRKLMIRPQDIAKNRMGEINFTAAHFNTGSSLERSIVTSTGPFIVTWNLRKVRLGKLDSYQIKRFRDNIVADDFAYNDDGRIVVTLPNNVGIARR